jgi:hypothetical protein
LLTKENCRCGRMPRFTCQKDQSQIQRGGSRRSFISNCQVPLSPTNNQSCLVCRVHPCPSGQLLGRFEPLGESSISAMLLTVPCRRECFKVGEGAPSIRFNPTSYPGFHGSHWRQTQIAFWCISPTAFEERSIKLCLVSPSEQMATLLSHKIGKCTTVPRSGTSRERTAYEQVRLLHPLLNSSQTSLFLPSFPEPWNLNIIRGSVNLDIPSSF